MRPKKRVVVFAENEVSRDVLCFTLEVWGYIACSARTAGQLRLSIASQHVDAVIAVLPGPRDRRVVRAAQALGTPVMSLDAKANAPRSCGNVSLSCKADPIEVREALRILAAHKRGPKKKQPVVAPSSAAEAVRAS